MTLLRSLTLATAAAITLAASNARGQDYYQTSTPYTQLFSAEEMDNLVAPIALYPDPILAQVFIAATFADQIDIAARHVRMFGDNSVDYQPWDVSVRAVAHYPPVLNMLAERTDWTAALGQAYAYQSDDLMDAVQRLRRMARSEGNLISTPQQTIIYERDYVRIVPAQPRVIYVPVYDPGVIYYRRSVFQASIHTPYWSFGVAFPIGSWLNYDCDWLGRRVYYDGWRGNGWRNASRPYIQIVNVYVNPRYEVVNINRTIINRRVNYVTLNTYNTVHRNVKFDSYERNVTRVVTSENGSRRGGSAGPQRGGGAVVQGNGRGVGRGSDVQSSGRGAGRGAAVPTQSPSRALPQQNAPTQSGQRTASPSGRAQPVERPSQAPVIQRQQSPQSAPQAAPRTAAPSGRGASSGRGQGGAQRPEQTMPSQVIRQPSNVPQQQRQQATVQQSQQRQSLPQQRPQPQQQQRPMPQSSRGGGAQSRSAPAQSSAPAAVSRGGGSRGGGSPSAQAQTVERSNGAASRGNGNSGQQSAPRQAKSKGGRGN